jgi:hypothetical protein
MRGLAVRQRNKTNKFKQQPTDTSKVWTKQKQLTKFHDSKLARDLASFEEFKESLLPMLARDVLDGMPPEEMREKYASLIQARLIQEAITSGDPAKATAAAKDVLDRAFGKATEKSEVKHTFENLKDEELDAILQSELQDLRGSEKKFQ